MHGYRYLGDFSVDIYQFFKQWKLTVLFLSPLTFLQEPWQILGPPFGYNTPFIPKLIEHTRIA